MATHEDQHLSWCDDALLRATTPFLRWLQPKHLVGSHERPLNVIDAGVDVTHNRRQPGPAEVVACFLYSCRASHLAQQVGGLVLIRRECYADMTVGDNAFIVAVGINDLADVLSD